MVSLASVVITGLAAPSAAVTVMTTSHPLFAAAAFGKFTTAALLSDFKINPQSVGAVTVKGSVSALDFLGPVKAPVTARVVPTVAEVVTARDVPVVNVVPVVSVVPTSRTPSDSSASATHKSPSLVATAQVGAESELNTINRPIYRVVPPDINPKSKGKINKTRYFFIKTPNLMG
jgi:hypothetical protein